MLNLQFENLTEIFNSFLNSFSYFICPRCSPKNYTQEFGHLTEKDVKLLPNNTPKEWGHHIGSIHKYIKSKQMKSSFINNFLEDTEHGFFHGLMTAFIMYLINLDANNAELTEQDYSSVLLHDFLKVNGYEQELHDKELIYFFDKLLPETYQHSNPSDKYKNNLLIKADRIELRRYDDYKEWVDERFYNLVSSLSKKTQGYLDIFYNNIRPALLYIYINKNKIFIRHGIERFNKDITFWPIDYIDYTNKDIYSIEIDRIPFSSLINNNISQNGYCSNHCGKAPWNKLKGYITKDDFTHYKGEIVIENCRDHLFAKSKIETYNWIFIVQNIDNPMGNNDNIRNEDIHLIYIKLLETEKHIVQQNSVFLFHKLIKLLGDRLIIIND